MSNKRFAEIGETNLVERVVVAESAEWCEEHLGGTWVETFKDRSQRYNYAGPGFTYDSEADAFIPPQPFASWVLTAEYRWEPPSPEPESELDDNGQPLHWYVWDEETTAWVVSE